MSIWRNWQTARDIVKEMAVDDSRIVYGKIGIESRQRWLTVWDGERRWISLEVVGRKWKFGLGIGFELHYLM
jgi:hypothetical protein